MNISNLSYISMYISVSRTVIFTILIVLAIPSVLCCIFILSQFVRRQQLSRPPTNLFIFFLILLCFLQIIIEMPMTLIYLRWNRVAYESYAFCQLWNILQYSFGSSIIWLIMVDSIVRYLFIFHSALLKYRPILLRKLPLAFALLQPISFNIILIIIAPPCISKFNYSRFMCGFPCFIFKKFWSPFIWNLFVGIPVAIIIIMNIILIIRVLRQKHQMKRTRVWSRNIKLIIYIAIVSLLAIIVWIPLYIIVQIASSKPHPSPSWLLVYIFMEILVYLPYLVITLCPVMSLVGIRKFQQPFSQMISRCFRRRHNRIYIIAPTGIHVHTC